MMHKDCWVKCPTRVGNFEASTGESARRVQLSGYQAVQHVAVEDLVLSQDDKPNRHWSARVIARETVILRSSVHRIIHRDLQLKCFERRHVEL